MAGAHVTGHEERHVSKEDILPHLALRRGMPVIVDDCDAPCTRMISVLTFFNHATGCWRARYLATYTRAAICHSDGQFGYPTPLAAFGKRILIHEGDSYSVEDNGLICSARYKSGLTRGWFDDKSVRQAARPAVLEFLKTHGLAAWMPGDDLDEAKAS